jgi:predicted MFS family arabinose efflux permease
LDLLLFAHEVLHVDDLRTGLMVTCLAIGIGAGSMLAGKLSGDKVELGLVPLGSVLMAVFSVRCIWRADRTAGRWDAGAAGPVERTVHRAAERLSAAAGRSA